MIVHILSARSGWHTDESCRALRERGHSGRVLPYEALVARVGGRSRAALTALVPDGGELFDADAVLARIVPDGSLEQIIYRVDALHWLEERGVRVVNSPRTIERCVDKFYTTALLHQAGVPTPETVVCEGADDAMAAMRSMLERGDVIVKPLFGSMGHGLVRVGDAEVGYRVVRALERIRSVFYLQQAIDHGGRDVRTFVIGGRAVAAIERIAPAGDWRTNVARGGRARAFNLPSTWAAAALRASAAVGADYAGVDLIESRDGEVFVIEVNGIPGWEGLQRATHVDVAGAIVDHVAWAASAEGRAGAAV
jgi:RimK family alpha-L-glutamate ligase